MLNNDNPTASLPSTTPNISLPTPPNDDPDEDLSYQASDESQTTSTPAQSTQLPAPTLSSNLQFTSLLQQLSSRLDTIEMTNNDRMDTLEQQLLQSQSNFQQQLLQSQSSLANIIQKFSTHKIK
jgi:hypothetical protein